MNSAEIERGVLSVKNLIDVAFPPVKKDLTPITIFIKSTYQVETTPQKPTIPYKVDLRQEPTDLETRIAQVIISSGLGLLDPGNKAHLDESFQESLRHSLLTKKLFDQNVQTIDVLRAFRNFLTGEDYHEFTNYHPLLKKWEVLEEYLLSMGVELIDKDGLKTSKGVQTLLPESPVSTEAVAETENTQNYPHTHRPFLRKLKDFFRNIHKS